jgi:hypothetical protein
MTIVVVFENATIHVLFQQGFQMFFYAGGGHVPPDGTRPLQGLSSGPSASE